MAGYLVFGLSAVILFQVAGVDPHAQSTAGFKIFSILWGIAFALGAGFFAAKLAPRRPLVHAAIVAALVGVAATVSLVGMTGTRWTQNRRDRLHDAVSDSRRLARVRQGRLMAPI